MQESSHPTSESTPATSELIYPNPYFAFLTRRASISSIPPNPVQYQPFLTSDPSEPGFNFPIQPQRQALGKRKSSEAEGTEMERDPKRRASGPANLAAGEGSQSQSYQQDPTRPEYVAPQDLTSRGTMRPAVGVSGSHQGQAYGHSSAQAQYGYGSYPPYPAVTRETSAAATASSYGYETPFAYRPQAPPAFPDPHYQQPGSLPSRPAQQAYTDYQRYQSTTTPGATSVASIYPYQSQNAQSNSAAYQSPGLPNSERLHSQSLPPLAASSTTGQQFSQLSPTYSLPSTQSEPQRPKPQCWDHGCNGREFSTFSNLLRHQRERSGTAAKSYCPRCGAEFTRSTARTNHLLHAKCKPRQGSQE